MKLVFHPYVAVTLLFFVAIAQANEYNANIIKAIKERMKDLPGEVDWRYCVPMPRKQLGPSCHTSSFGLQAMSSLCLAEGNPPEKSNIYDLSLTDFWSCKTHYGFQHKINVVNWWNQNGAMSVDQDQKWNMEFAYHCEQNWKKGLGGKQEGLIECRCRREPETKNPKGFLDPKKALVQPFFLDSKKSMVHCRFGAQGNINAWKNEINLAKHVAKYGPVSVMSSVQGFGYGSPQQPSHRCVKKGSGSGHNYNVVGYNFTDNPHTAYWILSDSIRKVGGFSYARMFVHCPDGYHAGALGIGSVKASRYCIDGDKRGRCAGNPSCVESDHDHEEHGLVEEMTEEEYYKELAALWAEEDEDGEDMVSQLFRTVDNGDGGVYFEEQ